MKPALRPLIVENPRRAPAPAAISAELVSAENLAAVAPAWERLCDRALEPNPFAEPAFLLPLIAYEQPKRLVAALVWRGERLIGLVLLQRPRFGLARVWMSAYAPLPAQVFDRDEATAAIAAVAGTIGGSGIVWPQVERGGAFAAALGAADLPLRLAGSRRRTALRLKGVAAFDAGLNPKRRTKWARKARKLVGKVEATPGPEGIEAFFEVERKGWKGERRTALADDARRLAFAREALGAFAAAGRLDALTLRLDGVAVAAGLVLTAGDRAFYWKTAYDEAHADASPGVQLTLAHSRRLAARLDLATVDSCAIEDHPMIGRVWGDALVFEDWAMGLKGKRSLSIWLAAHNAKAAARETIKRWIYKALGRKRV